VLAKLLSTVKTARDLTPVFQALGYAPDVCALPDGELRIARWKGFEVLGRDAERPEEEARSLAARLAARAQRALVAAVGAGELAIAAPRLGLGGSSRVLLLSLANPDPGALHLLERLCPADAPHPLGHALRVGELLSTESIGERFYRSFRDILDTMAASLGRRGTPAERRTAALLPLTRILFLYFVQAKGWLDGRPDYLRRLLDASLARRRHFHRTALHPLFFGTLNRKPSDRRVTIKLGRIPYLNGGLFEPHPVERRLGPVLFSNPLWRDAFDGLFERFRFSIHESQRVDAIAPDMLGRVFERVMDSGDRHRTGTFYTPESVVRQVVDAAIETAIGREPNADALRAFRILDPAVGSGAFLLCALERLTALRLAASHGRSRAAQLRREILRDNLFGVDVNPIAVRLAELRLWLAVIADDPTTEISRIAPLPNLDGVIRQGDTLLDPIGAARALSGDLPYGPAAAVRLVSAARRAVFTARGRDRRGSAAELRTSEVGLASRLVETAAHAAARRLKELTCEEQSLDLFGNPKGLTLEQREERKALQAQQERLSAAQDSLRDGQVPFFSFEVHAAEIMAAGGFNLVVGNPPWVRAERLAPDVKRTLRERFSWWHSGGGEMRGFAHPPDLSVAFLQRAVELAAPGGAVALLLPSKLATAHYAEAARRAVVRETSVAYLHRVSDREAAAFGATTYPLAVVLRKEPPAEGSVVKLGWNGERTAVTQRLLDRPGPWVLVPDHLQDAIEQFRTSGRRLAEVAAPGLGVKTGADGMFVGRIVQRSGTEVVLRLDGEDIAIEAALIRPALRGRDVTPFGMRPREVVLWCYDHGTPLAVLPPLARRYFSARLDRLQARSDRQAGPEWMVFRTRGALAPHPVAWADITRRPAAVALGPAGPERSIPLNTCYVAGAPDEQTALAITAVFNSTWTHALVQVIADEARGGYRRVNARVAGEIPVPADVRALQSLASVSRRAHANQHVDPDDLDDAVAEALDLTPRTRQSLRALAADRR